MHGGVDCQTNRDKLWRMTVERGIVERMQLQVDAWDTAADRRAIFLSCYTMMTRNMVTAVEQGRFEDARWVSEMLTNFAGYYFAAVEAYDQQRRCSAVWQAAFDATRLPDTHVIQNLFLGVNAHINYDLMLTLVDLLQDSWADLSTEQRDGRYQDYRAVNDIIAATINDVQDQIIERYDPQMDLVDRFLGPLDERLIAQLISSWREEVWDHALELLCSTDLSGSALLQARVEAHTLNRAGAISGKRGIEGLLDLL